jgi:hypothetical protein
MLPAPKNKGAKDPKVKPISRSKRRQPITAEEKDETNKEDDCLTPNVTQKQRRSRLTLNVSILPQTRLEPLPKVSKQ